MKKKLTFFALAISFTTVYHSGRLLAAPQNTPAQGSSQAKDTSESSESRAPAEVAFGSIASVGVDRFQLKKMNGSVQTVLVDDQTRYREEQHEAKLEDLKPGEHVWVRERTNDKKEFVASLVHAVTGEEMARFQGRAFGEIVSIEENRLKLRNPRQGEKIVVVNDQTAFMKDGQPATLKDFRVGDRVTAMGKETDGQFVATRVMSGRFRGGGGERHKQDNAPEQH